MEYIKLASIAMALICALSAFFYMNTSSFKKAKQEADKDAECKLIKIRSQRQEEQEEKRISHLQEIQQKSHTI